MRSTPYLTGLDPRIEAFVAAGVFGPAEQAFVEMLNRRKGFDLPSLVQFGAAAAVWGARNGHTCVHLDDFEGAVHRATATFSDSSIEFVSLDELQFPDTSKWHTELKKADEEVVGEPNPSAGTPPLILDKNKLFLARHHSDETIIAKRVKSLLAAKVSSIPVDDELLERLLPATPGEENLQLVASRSVFDRAFSLLLGGPGTGKTYTVARTLVAYLAADGGGHRKVAVVAPTNKAAVRLKENLRGAIDEIEKLRGVGGISLGSEVIDRLRAVEPSTIHRLLGSKGPDSQRFRHDDHDPLEHDLVVVDEVSMVPVPLMARLLEALRGTGGAGARSKSAGTRECARLMLVGDPGQLPSVELGAVLADLELGSESALSGLAKVTTRLRISRRVSEGSLIPELAARIRRGDAEEVLRMLKDPVIGLDPGVTNPEALTAKIRFVSTNDPIGKGDFAKVSPDLSEHFSRLRELAQEGDVAEAVSHSLALRVLCGHRRGRHGVSDWNKKIGEMVSGRTNSPMWFPGRLVMVTRNDPRLGLANGDVGVVFQDKKALGGPALRVAFGDPDEPKILRPNELESVETAFAMTIHKSQGSEFGHVLVVLPPDGSRLTSRELFYTAVTRAKDRVTVMGTESAVADAVKRSDKRMSGLADMLG